MMNVFSAHVFLIYSIEQLMRDIHVGTHHVHCSVPWTGPLYIHHLLETINENRGQVIRDSMGRHVRGFFIFYVCLRVG